MHPLKFTYLSAIAFLWGSNCLFGQVGTDGIPCDPEKTYYSLEKALEQAQCVVKFSYRLEKKEWILPEIGLLNQLEYIDLKNNHLFFLPEEMGQLTRLKHVILSENHLRKLPEAIATWQELAFLQVDNNALIELPQNIANLNKLEILDASWNEIARLPD